MFADICYNEALCQYKVRICTIAIIRIMRTYRVKVRAILKGRLWIKIWVGLKFKLGSYYFD